eukprot:m.113757 g.113757  ORF g.113757 m.113757 type:complete len:90 (+) comp16260_c0_seq3:153-422(+)
MLCNGVVSCVGCGVVLCSVDMGLGFVLLACCCGVVVGRVRYRVGRVVWCGVMCCGEMLLTLFHVVVVAWCWVAYVLWWRVVDAILVVVW